MVTETAIKFLFTFKIIFFIAVFALCVFVIVGKMFLGLVSFYLVRKGLNGWKCDSFLLLCHPESEIVATLF